MRSLGIDSGPFMDLEFHTGKRTPRGPTSIKELNQWKPSQSSTAIYHYLVSPDPPIQALLPSSPSKRSLFKGTGENSSGFRGREH